MDFCTTRKDYTKVEEVISGLRFEEDDTMKKGSKSKISNKRESVQGELAGLGRFQ